MSQISRFANQNAQLDALFDDVIAGRKDASVAQAARSVLDAKTRRYEVEIKRAVKGGFLKDIAPQWREEHLSPVSAD